MPGLAKAKLRVQSWGMVLLVLVLHAFPAGAQEADAKRVHPGGAGFYEYRIIRSYPHDKDAFTQGLVYADGFLYEGTGLYGHSTLRMVELSSGRVVRKISLAQSFFGEGVAVFGNRIVQFTWRSRTGFVYNRDTFEPLGKFSYDYEGWGATNCKKKLIVSDGTSLLHFWDTNPFRETKTMRIHDGGHPVEGLNELECVNGDIYANVWLTNYIAVINPETGGVKGWLDMKGLLSGSDARGADVPNGIAYDEKGDRLFVTGKLWPRVFEIKVVNQR